MMFMPFDSTIILLIPAILFAVYAQFKVKSAYSKYSKIFTSRGINGAEVARYILQSNNLSNVNVEEIEGELTDFYDPRKRVLKLSTGNFSDSSIASLGVAAHEAGHAIQHGEGYYPLQLRNKIAPAAQFGSTLAFPLILAGLFISSFSVLMDVGIILYSVAVFFTLITLPVEFDASKRALVALNRGGFLNAGELTGAKKVLDAAALTYLAAAASAVLNLIRLILIRDD